jgi:hypothetical protein
MSVYALTLFLAIASFMSLFVNIEILKHQNTLLNKILLGVSGVSFLTSIYFRVRFPDVSMSFDWANGAVDFIKFLF